MVGLRINDAAVTEESDERYFKLKIYACDDSDDDDDDLEDDVYNWYRFYHLSCNTERIQKCSRLIFVWTYGGRGIDFLDGHGIPFNVSF